MCYLQHAFIVRGTEHVLPVPNRITSLSCFVFAALSGFFLYMFSQTLFFSFLFLFSFLFSPRQIGMPRIPGLPTIQPFDHPGPGISRIPGSGVWVPVFCRCLSVHDQPMTIRVKVLTTTLPAFYTDLSPPYRLSTQLDFFYRTI